MKTMEIELKTDADYQRWAWEALVNYASYRVNGDAPGILRVLPSPPDWPEGQIPALDDLWKSGMKFDFEQHDYVMVRLAISEQIKRRPMDYWLPEFLTHCLYLNHRVGDFAVNLPFQTQKTMLGTLGRGACDSARVAVAELMRAVTELKRQQNSRNLEKSA